MALHAAVGVSHALEMDGVARNFGARWVLRGIDLQLRAGEALALMGRNGSGKTTLLRIAATLLRPARGSARVFGADTIERAAEVRPVIGMLGHAPGLYDDLTAAENLRFAFNMRGEPADPARTAELLHECGLAEDADSLVRGFSAGMRRRLALARILSASPRLILLDEPYASFDADGIALVNRMIAAACARGAGVLVATHDLTRAEGVLTRVLHLDDGRLTE